MAQRELSMMIMSSKRQSDIKKLAEEGFVQKLAGQ